MIEGSGYLVVYLAEPRTVAPRCKLSLLKTLLTYKIITGVYIGKIYIVRCFRKVFDKLNAREHRK